MYKLFRQSTKTGKLDTVLSSGSPAMLKLWALQNTTKSKTTLLYDPDGHVIYKVVGQASGFPKVFDRSDKNDSMERI